MGDVADEITVGHVGPMADRYTPNGIPFLRSQNVRRLRLDLSDVKYIPEEFDEQLRKSRLRPGDVVVVRTGDPGACAVIPKSLPVANCADLVIVRPGPMLDSSFAAYFINDIGRHHVASHLVGAVQQHFNVGAARTLPMKLPSIVEQRAIAGVLSALDDKIEQNRALARALERLALATFRAWFVNFEPVKAKAAGSTAFPGMPQSVFESLPTGLVTSEIGPVPEGWTVRPLSSVCTLVSGGTPKRSVASYWGGNVPWYSVRDAPEVSEVWVVDTSEKITDEGLAKSAARMVPKGCTIISARGTVGKLAMAGVPMAFNQSCYGLMPGDGISFCHLHLLLKATVADLQQRTHGSVFDTITRATFDGLAVVVSPRETVTAFESAATPLFDLLLGASQEVAKLVEMRDYLLPKLLSGQIPVEDASG